MTKVRAIRLAWREGVGANPKGAGDWFHYTHREKQFLEMVARMRCKRWGAGSHWVEETDLEMDEAEDAKDRADDREER